MNTYTMQQAIQTAKILHYRHGKGDVLNVRVYADGKIEVRAKSYLCLPHVVRGHLKGNTVYLYRHQKLIAN